MGGWFSSSRSPYDGMGETGNGTPTFYGMTRPGMGGRRGEKTKRRARKSKSKSTSGKTSK